MKLVSTWPTNDRLAIPPAVFEQLINLLIEPFGDEKTARDFWAEEACSLLYFTRADNVSELVSLGVLNRSVMDHALNFPDISEVLIDGYLLNLAITSDSGGGTYLLLHPTFSPTRAHGGENA